MTCSVFIWNVPDYVYEHKYIVARYSSGEWWFFGAYDDESRAKSVAEAESGAVFTNTDVI